MESWVLLHSSTSRPFLQLPFLFFSLALSFPFLSFYPFYILSLTPPLPLSFLSHFFFSILTPPFIFFILLAVPFDCYSRIAVGCVCTFERRLSARSLSPFLLISLSLSPIIPPRITPFVPVLFSLLTHLHINNTI